MLFASSFNLWEFVLSDYLTKTDTFTQSLSLLFDMLEKRGKPPKSHT